MKIWLLLSWCVSGYVKLLLSDVEFTVAKLLIEVKGIYSEFKDYVSAGPAFLYIPLGSVPYMKDRYPFKLPGAT